jgi:D-tyrosyl-tRNA(Tyr) deacylase
MISSPNVRAVVQRVAEASCRVDGEIVGAIGPGLVVLLGVGTGDREADADQLADKVLHLRVFSDEAGQMNRSVIDVSGGLLVVSQFTLLGDVRKGRRPSFTGAASPEMAEPMVEHFAEALRQTGIHTETGVFAATMEVELVNDGPVTLVLEVRDGRVS